MATYEGGVSDGTGVSNNTDTLVLAIPDPHQADDYAIVFCTANNGSTWIDITANAEYTELQNGIVIDAQDETSYENSINEGTFNGVASAGSYLVNDEITLSDNTVITVNAVVTGDVTEFTVDSSGANRGTEFEDVLTQSSVSPDTGQTGFTLTPRGDNLSGFPVIATTGSDVSIHCFYRKLTSASDTDITLTKASTARMSGVMHLWRGLDTTDPFDADAETDLFVNASYISTSPAITPVTDNGGLILVAHYPGPATGFYVTTFGAPATPSGLTQGASFIPNDGSDYQDITTAYDADYGTAAIITPTKWLNEIGGAKIADTDDETDYDGSSGDGTFVGGTGGTYSISDVITITGGATVTVDNVSAGVVTEFTVSQGADTGGHAEDDVLSQTSVSPDVGQTGFSLTLGYSNLQGGTLETAAASLVLRPSSGTVTQGLSQLGTYGMNTMTGGFK